MSFDLSAVSTCELVEELKGDVRDAILYRSRCKPGAQAMAQLAFDALEVAHG